MTARKKVDAHPVGKPVMVRWIDSMSTGGWDAKGGSRMEITSVGFLLDGPKDRVVICQNRSHYSDGEIMEIPQIAVKSVRKLKE